MLAVCAVGAVWIVFSRLSFLFSFVDGPIEPDIVSEKKKKKNWRNNSYLGQRLYHKMSTRNIETKMTA